MQLETCATFVKIMSRRPMKKSGKEAKKIRKRRKTALVGGSRAIDVDVLIKSKREDSVSGLFAACLLRRAFILS